MPSRRKAFTLIELMIVIAIIAIIAAIAIPSLLRARIAANETSATAALKQFVSTESVWRQTDADSNGVQDYWTRDVCGFYGVTDTGGTTVRFVDIAVAKADLVGNADYAGAPGRVGAPSAKAGYWFRAMLSDEFGAAYQQQLGTSPGPYTNETEFAFCAYPLTYEATGVRLFIVNQMGVIFQKDMGNAVAATTWPASDPTTSGWSPTQ